MLRSDDVGPNVVDLLLFPNSSMGCNWSWHRGVPRRCATSACVSLLTTCPFIGSQSLVGDDTSLDLAMVVARRLFQCVSRGRWSLTVATCFGVCRKLYGWFCIFSIL
jgi:hypothetical protein